MRVSGLNNNGDWTFGAGLANYKIDSEAVRQNLQTRLKSFVGDWFLDIEAGIDWLTLLGERETEDQILSDVQRVTLATTGIARIESLEISTDRQLREATIFMSVTDVFSQTYETEVGIDG